MPTFVPLRALIADCSNQCGSVGIRELEAEASQNNDFGHAIDRMNVLATSG